VTRSALSPEKFSQNSLDESEEKPSAEENKGKSNSQRPILVICTFLFPSSLS